VCPDHLHVWDGSSICSQSCIYPCPSPLYDDEDYRMMWVFYIIPGVLSVPFNAYIFGGFWVGRRNVHKGSRQAIQIAVCLALLWAFVEIFPALMLYTDTQCQSDYAAQQGESTWCHISRGTIHIVQSMFYWIMAAILDLNLAVVKEKTLRERDNVHKKMLGFCFGVPAVMLLLTYSLQFRDQYLIHASGASYSNRAWNSTKDVFSCSPLFEDIYTEFFIVYLHFVIAGVAIIALLVPIAKTLLKSATKVGTSSAPRIGSVTGMMKIIEKSGAKKIIQLGCIATVLLILNLIVIATTVPKIDEFAAQQEKLNACTVIQAVTFAGQTCLETAECCDHLDPANLGIAPSVLVLALGYYFAVPAIPLTIGIIFSGDKKHRDAWKKTKLGSMAVAMTTRNSNKSSGYSGASSNGASGVSAGASGVSVNSSGD